MGSGGIDDNGIRILHHGSGFPGCVIRQAEEYNIRPVQRIPAGGRILPELFGKNQKGQIGTGGQALPDPQAGGSGTAVNKNLGHKSLPSRNRTRKFV